MKKITTGVLMLMLTAITLNLNAQGKYFTRNGNVIFNSGTSLEKIEGVNHKASSVMDGATGQLEMNLLVKAFEFERALMEDHFNENYMESEKFPKASFKGTIVNIKDIPFEKGGTFTLQVKGDITIHGVTRPITVTASGEVKNNKIYVKSHFEVTLADFKVEIPGVVADKIDKQAKIEVDLVLEPLTK